MTDQEVNEAVAKKMGWENKRITIENPKTLGWVREGWFEPKVPDYCHSIEWAWEIVECCIAPLPADPDKIAQYDFELNHINEKDGWIASFVDQGELHGAYGYHGRADTPARAICLAFLKLKDVLPS